MEITKDKIDKINELLDLGLVKGFGDNLPGKMCVEVVINKVLYGEYNDRPKCVNSSIRHLMVKLNDAKWSNNQARANGLRNLAILQLGTSNNFDYIKFVEKLVIMVVNKIIPEIMDNKNIADQCRNAKTLEEAKKVANRAEYASCASYIEYITHAAGVASIALNSSVTTYAKTHANLAASNAAGAAKHASYVYASKNKNGDDILNLFAKEVEHILIEMEVPGVKFLNLNVQN